MRFLLISVLMLSITTFAQEENSREFADGVIELTTVKVKTNFLQDYLDGIEQTWVAAAKIQQEMGIIGHGSLCPPSSGLVKLHHLLSVGNGSDYVASGWEQDLCGENPYDSQS